MGFAQLHKKYAARYSTSGLFSMYGAFFLFACTCETEKEGEKEGVCFVPRKALLSYTYNKSIASKTTTFKQRCLTPTPLLAHTHTQLQMPTHSFTYTIRILVQQGLLFVTICAWRTKWNEAEEEGSERKGGLSAGGGPALLSLPCADGPCCCTSGHMPREPQWQSSVVGAMRWVTGTCVCVYVCVCICVCVCLMHDSEAQLTMCGTERLQK